MSKILDDKDRINYKIERISERMSREELNKLYEEFKSDDDYVNFHVENIEDTHNKYYITVMNDEKESPIKNSNENISYGFMRVNDALEFINDYIDAGRCNSKQKYVMQQGYSKKSVDKYNDLVKQEKEESKSVNEFTKPSFEEVMNNVYMNGYNGETYNESDELLPDELREDVGIIIPGLIETREEYFDFVKRLKDRGKNGLGRSIYARYEDYEEALDLITQYKEALFNKYGGKDEFFHAKQLGGIFGAYEYYPEVKPRFKKTKRNIKLSKGINLNELALVEDMGRRIREEYEEEIEMIEVNQDENVIYENTPPKFKDLPEDLGMFYKTDKYGINGFTHTDKFKTLREYANELIRTKDAEKMYEGHKILEELSREEWFYSDSYDSEFVTIVDNDDLSQDALLSQFEYDKLMYQCQNDEYYVDEMIDVTESRKSYTKFVKNQLKACGYDESMSAEMKTDVVNMSEHATKYVFDAKYKADFDKRNELNSAGDVLYRNNVKMMQFGKDSSRQNMKADESKVKHYVSELINNTKQTITSAKSDADNIRRNTSTSIIDQHDICSDYSSDISYGFDLESKPKEVLKYMKNNEEFAKRVYEVGSDNNVGDLFSERTNIDDFANEISKSTKPMITEDLIDRALQNNRKVGK